MIEATPAKGQTKLLSAAIFCVSAASVALGVLNNEAPKPSLIVALLFTLMGTMFLWQRPETATWAYASVVLGAGFGAGVGLVAMATTGADGHLALAIPVVAVGTMAAIAGRSSLGDRRALP